MLASLTYTKRYDWLLIGAILMLVSVGLITLFSLKSVSGFPYFERQLIWLGLGVVFLVILSTLDYRFFRTQSWVVLCFYILSVILLVAVMAGSFSVRGVEGWFKIGSVLIQPAEIAKIILIILFAKFFSKRHIEIYQVRHLLISALYLLAPSFLVILQPDLGSAFVMVSIWLSIVIFSGMRMRHVFFLFVIVLLLAIFSWVFVLEPYQTVRITSFLNPYSDPEGAGYQMIQSVIAVGSGRIWGKGLGYGSQSHLNFLPEAQTDFIFAAFAEEWGFLGVMAILTLISVVIWRIVLIGMRSADSFSRLYSLGFAALIFVQSFIHIGMNMGVLPVTGLTLPFVSYGGSSLVSLFIGLGILQNIKINSRKEID